jgi:hypothetical protein
MKKYYELILFMFLPKAIFEANEGSFTFQNKNKNLELRIVKP